MSVREALVLGGYVSLAVGVLLLALAAWTYVAQDIHGVRADLEGRKRRARLTPVMARVDPLPVRMDDRTAVGLEVAGEGEEETLSLGGGLPGFFVVTKEVYLAGDGKGGLR